MGLFDRFKQFFNPKEEVKTSHSGYVGNSAVFNGLANSGHGYTATTNEELFSIISRMANILCTLPVHRYHNYEESDDAVAQLLVSQPNPYQSSFDFLNTLEVSRNVDGNGYAWIERDEYATPIAMWVLNPDSVIIMRDTEDNSVWYRVDDNYGHHFLLPTTDIIHVKQISVGTDSLYGVSPIDVLRGALEFHKSVVDFSTNEMANKDMFVLKYDNSINDEARNATIADFNAMMKAKGGAVILQAGWSVEKMNTTFNSADLTNVESISRTRIANAFNVPLSFLNDGQAKNTVNVEHIMANFVVMTLMPIVKQYEAEFNRKLLTPDQRAKGNRFRFNVNGLLRGDTAARTEFYQMMIRNGIATTNELRTLEGLPPSEDESANVLWISKDLYPAENQLKASTVEAEKGGEDFDPNENDSGD